MSWFYFINSIKKFSRNKKNKKQKNRLDQFTSISFYFIHVVTSFNRVKITINIYLLFINISQLITTWNVILFCQWMGGSTKALVRYVPPRFSKKQGLRNWYFGSKMGSPEQNFAKICVSGELKFSQNRPFLVFLVNDFLTF